MKNLLNLGKALSKAEQKHVLGGGFQHEDCTETGCYKLIGEHYVRGECIDGVCDYSNSHI